MDLVIRKIAEADVLLTRLDEIDTKIYNLRSKELFGNLMDKQASLIYPSNLLNANKLFVVFVYDIIYSPISWFDELNKEETEYVGEAMAKRLIAQGALGLLQRAEVMANKG